MPRGVVPPTVCYSACVNAPCAPAPELAPHAAPGFLSPAQIFTHLNREWIAGLSPAERVVLSRAFDVWIRPEQQIPAHMWKTLGLTGGRGFGKSIAVARYVNGRVMAGLESHVALMAPTEARTEEVQVRALIDYAERGQAPERFTRNKTSGLRWPNGVEAVLFTPEAPGRSRSENISLTWCTEIVDWKPSSAKEAFQNLFTATRTGEARTIWDSTAKGRNELRTLLEEWNDGDPREHVIMPGTMFDNPLLSTPYLRGQWQSYVGVRRDEELLGMSFRESAGALWKQAYFDEHRRTEAPALAWTIVTVDPAISHEYATADETGIMVGGRATDEHAYVTEDASGRHPFETWGDLAVDRAHPSKPGAGRIGIERKRIGDGAVGCIRSRAENRGLRVRVIGKDEPWPAWDPACIFIREYNTNDSKGTRAEGPAAETASGRVHLVDPGHPDAPRFADLERECTTYVPGVTTRSPNRLDAFAYLVTELRELRRDSPPNHAADAAAAVGLNAAVQAALSGRPATAAHVAQRLAGGVGVTVASRRLGL